MTRCLRIALLLLGLWFPLVAGWSGARAQPAAAAQNPAASPSVLLTLEGRVEVLRAGTQQWIAGSANQVLAPGDRLRTGIRSRATLRLTDLSVLRLNELSTLEIRPPASPGKKGGLDLRAGGIYFFNRERPTELDFRTPVASGAIRGTEFHLTVAEDGSTVLTLLDGEVSLSNAAGEVILRNGEQATVAPGAAPVRTPALEILNVIQWTLYYPAVLDADEALLAADEKSALAASIQHYHAGDLLAALAAYPDGREPGSDAERVYLAALLLSVGQVGRAEELLDAVATHASVKRGLLKMIRLVKRQPVAPTAQPASATEWMAEAYFRQSRGEIESALAAAGSVTRISENFGFGWARLAELEFGCAHTDLARAAVEKSLEVSPRNAQALALLGFLYAAKNHREAALDAFDRATAIDPALGNAWLGRGLVRIRQGQREAGRADLQVAAALEPQRGLFRSYLGKAFSHEHDNRRAVKELALAQRLDPNDPTAWLYSALVLQQENRANEAISDLERSKELNDNRNLYRSRLLLDQDRAVRSANLASIYRDAGMLDVSVREASRAVNDDYGNYSAHLFLANSYDAIRDPKLINLRYEAAWFSELLTANLLAPAGSASLAQNVSQQEYSRLFDGNRLGFSSSTEYFSSGDWVERASQYGLLGNTAYSIDGYYRSENGQRPNNDLRQRVLSGRFKQQLTPANGLFVEASYFDSRSGDVKQYYDQDDAGTSLRVSEKQEPNVLAGYHHEWSPGVHTLLLAGRFDDTVEASDPDSTILWLRRNGGGTITGVADPNFSIARYQTDLTAYSAEAQQIWQTPRHTTVLGLRGQGGWADSFNELTNALQTVVASQSVETDFWRLSAYGYHQWEVVDALRFTVGLSYDHLSYPRNIVVSPISDDEEQRDHFGPKAGVLWTPLKNTHVRAAYTRSLGGAFFENSVRLEPTQVAGFNQAFRSLVPESTAGLAPGTEFETFHAGFDHKFPTRTYVSIEGELLQSDVTRQVGVFITSPLSPPGIADTPSSTRQTLDFEERTVLVTLNQLIDDEWVVGVRYRLTQADLESRFIDVPVTAAGASADNTATLHQARPYVLFNHRCGFFAGADTVWSHQTMSGYTPARPTEDFWQFNVHAGFRFLQRRAEARVGLLNITDQDYRLDPLTLYSELPRERTLTVSLRLNF